MSQFSIRTRLWFLIALCLAGMAGVTATSLWMEHDLADSMRRTFDVEVVAANDLQVAAHGIANLRRFEKDAFLAIGDAKKVASQTQRWQATLEQVRTRLQSTGRIVADAATREAVAQATQGIGRYAEGFQKVLATIAAGGVADAPAADKAMGPVKDVIRDTEAAVATLAEARLAAAAAERAGLEQRGIVMVYASLGALLVAAGLAAVVAWATIRGIVLPLAAATQAARRIRDGDLSQTIRVPRSDETGQLLAAMCEMQAALAEVVGDVRRNADSVAHASVQIAQGNQDLSSRTEQQAGALQQTAASMEELGSTVRANADNAHQANQFAQGASSVALRGGEVVGQVVETMRSIDESARKMADIIAVIDGIAFQTNILALNAAVEAARAGEQGRGFAVVAAEVRSLAQRSATAAKEIKGLITTSVERVVQGTQLVDRAGGTMQEIVTSIRRVTDIMSEISAASAEQSSGVAQIGQAVAQMDRSTQQNAVLVEQSAEAAAGLEEQAARLLRAVEAFTLATPGAAPSTGAAGAAGATNVTRPAFGAARAAPEARRRAA